MPRPNDNRYYQIAQAFLRTPDVATFGEEDDLCQQSSIGVTLDLILAPELGDEDKNLLTADALQELRKVEDEILGREKFSKYCTLTYDTCSSTNPYQAYKTSSDCCVQVCHGAHGGIVAVAVPLNCGRPIVHMQGQRAERSRRSVRRCSA